MGTGAVFGADQTRVPTELLFGDRGQLCPVLRPQNQTGMPTNFISRIRGHRGLVWADEGPLSSGSNAVSVPPKAGLVKETKTLPAESVLGLIRTLIRP